MRPIKFAGYTAAGRFLSMQYDRDVSAWKVGAIRTLIGMAAGAAYFVVWNFFERSTFQVKAVAGYDHWFYLAGLLPVRIAEWWLLIWLFYDRELREVAKGWRMVGLGVIWSYVLDAPAIAGFIATAGFWVC
jgi:hypothetical protein